MIIMRFITIGGQMVLPLANDKKPQQIFDKIKESKESLVEVGEFSVKPEQPAAIVKENLCYIVCEVKSDIAQPDKKIQTPGRFGIN